MIDHVDASYAGEKRVLMMMMMTMTRMTMRMTFAWLILRSNGGNSHVNPNIAITIAITLICFHRSKCPSHNLQEHIEKSEDCNVIYFLNRDPSKFPPHNLHIGTFVMFPIDLILQHLPNGVFR